MRPSRILANLVGMMLFVQVVLGGGSVVLRFPVEYHLVWGVLTFLVLVAAEVLAARDFGLMSPLSKVAIASIADFVVQGILGLMAFNSAVAIVVHLTNAFLLAVLVTYLISFVDSADRAAAARAVSAAERARS